MSKIKPIWINILVCVVSYLFLCAGISRSVSPFFIAFVFACFYVDENYLNYIFGLVVSRLVYEFSWSGAFATINFVAVIIIFNLVQKRTKCRPKIFTVFLIMFLGSLIEVVYALSQVDTFILSVINKLLEFVFLYAYIMLFRAVKVRGINTKFALDELLGLALIIAPIALASAKISFYGLALSQFIIPLCILFVAFLYGGVEAITFAVISGVGVAFKNLDLTMVAVWVFYAVSAVSVKRLGRFMMAFILIFVELVVGFYFGVYGDFSILNLIPLIFSGFIFVCIPKKFLSKIRLYICSKYEDICFKELILKEEQGIKEKIKQVSKLFLEMHNIYKDMVIGRLDCAQVEDVLVRDIVNQNCKNCHKYKQCYEGKGLAYRALGELVKKGIGKRKVSLVDTPTILTTVCAKTNQIIFQLNVRLEEYSSYEKEIIQEDESKVIMSDQLLGVSEILDELGLDFDLGMRTDKTIEKSLIESFLYNDIIVKECAIFNDLNGLKRIVLVLKNGELQTSQILSVTREFFHIKTKITDVRYTKLAGWQIVFIEPDYKYNYTFGVAKTSKHNKSGDTYSELNLNGCQTMFAISDGKGCGTDASKISEMTINLIEDFYKAGFSSEHIVNNVNKVMAYKSGENFSAVDVCVLDLNLGRVDFVKRGGTPSVIKRINRIQLIEGKDLPVGILENATSNVVSYYLSSGDVIVLASDGVFDAFNTSENFAGFINNLPSINMQEFAGTILNEAIKINRGQVSDDMTVLAIKLLLNR